jgi:hypothetical protein
MKLLCVLVIFGTFLCRAGALRSIKPMTARHQHYVSHTGRKKDLILRSLERRLQMQFSMARKFPLRYNVKHSKMRNFTFDAQWPEKNTTAPHMYM